MTVERNMKFDVRDHAEGLILPVRAQPGARKTQVLGERNGALKLAVVAPADEGRANKALIELLQDVLRIKKSQIELIHGDKSRDKRFLIRSMSRAELESRLSG